MKKCLTAVVAAFAAFVLSFSCLAANLILVGDSTLAPRKPEVKLGSWGDALKPSLCTGNDIRNFAVGGRTVRTTLPTWKKTLAAIKSGDFVIIQFGINDANPKKLVKEQEFKETLAKFADDVVARGGIPVFCSPIAAGGYPKNAKPDAKYTPTKTRRVYGDYTKAVADAKKFAYVDMTALVEAELAKIGKEKTHAYFTCETTRKDRTTGEEKPIFDLTHPSKAGAARFAELFLADVRARKLPVAALFK